MTTNDESILYKKLPAYMKKMASAIENMELLLDTQKSQLANTEKEFQKFKKCALNFIDNTKKEFVKKQRKPSGFVLPVLISNDLCDFLEKPRGTHIPRTEVTKFIIQYISKNNLINPDKKTQVVPDERLLKLLGNDVDLASLTRFNIQKYMNKHFIRETVIYPELRVQIKG
jgi:chromatin remodeling complex protein RSC6